MNRIFYFFIFIIFICTSTYASEKKLILNDLFHHVVNEDPEILQKKYIYEENIKLKKIAESGYYPTVDITSTIGKEKKEYSINTTNNKYTDISIDTKLNIYNGGFDTYNNNYSNLKIESSKYSLQETIDKNIVASAEVYINILRNYELLESSKDVVNRYYKFYKDIEKKFEVGVGTLLEMSKAKSMYDSSLLDLNKQENSYNEALIELEYYSNDNNKNIKLFLPTIDFNFDMSIEEALNIAYSMNPIIKVSEINKKIIESEYKRDSSTFKPKLDLISNFTKENQDTSTLEENYNIKLELSYNLFNGFKDTHLNSKNRKIYKQKSQILQNIKRDVRKETSQVINNYHNIKKRLKYLNRYYKSQIVSLYTSHKEFSLAKTNLTSLILVENDFVSAKKEIINSNYDFLITKFRILEAIGESSKILLDNNLQYKEEYVNEKLNKLTFKNINIKEWSKELKR